MLNQEEIDKLSIDEQLRHIMLDAGRILLSTRIAYMYYWEGMRKSIDKYISLRPKMNQLCIDFTNLSTEKVISNLVDKEDYEGCKETVKRFKNIIDSCTEIMDDIEQNMEHRTESADPEFYVLIDKVNICLSSRYILFTQTCDHIDEIKDIILSKWFSRIDSIIDSILNESADSNYTELLPTYESDINAVFKKLLDDVETKIPGIYDMNIGPEDKLFALGSLKTIYSVFSHINN